jgi:hypothetical protein
MPQVSRAKPTSATCGSAATRIAPKECPEYLKLRHAGMGFFHPQSVFGCVLSNWQLIIEKNKFSKKRDIFTWIQPDVGSSFTSDTISYCRSFITATKNSFSQLLQQQRRILVQRRPTPVQR